MNYQQTLDYMFSQLPMFQRIGAAAYKADLNNTIELISLVQNPHEKFRTVHVAGTNGKGSTSHFIASILQESGLKVGLYTSPHLVDFRERIKINGEMISKDYVCNFVELYKNDFERISPSFFEMTVAMAFSYFAEMQVDVAVIEVGLGGRLDSTNIITPDVSIITNIGLDHTQFLGNTLAAVASEKAGIIKPNVPVVIGETHPETKPVFIAKAKEANTSITFADDNIVCEAIDSDDNSDETALQLFKVLRNNEVVYPKIESPLLGYYQRKNLATVFTSIDKLIEQGYKISKEQVVKGIRNVIDNTGLMGRWQIIQRNPLVIADIGHNADGLRENMLHLSRLKHDLMHFVIGVANDKDVEAMMPMFPKNAKFYFCKASIPRALNEAELLQKAVDAGYMGTCYADVPMAYTAALKEANQDDLIYVGGSAFVVADLLGCLMGR